MSAELWTACRAELEAKFQAGEVQLKGSRALPASPGVYAVLQAGEVLYVGMAKNLRVRWIGQHEVCLRDGIDQQQALIFWASMTHAEAAYWEIVLIERLQPRLNFRGVPANSSKLVRHLRPHIAPQLLEQARARTAKVETELAAILLDLCRRTPDGTNARLLAEIARVPLGNVTRSANRKMRFPLCLLIACVFVSPDHGRSMLEAIVQTSGLRLVPTAALLKLQAEVA